MPKPFLMILDWVHTKDGWRMATDIALPVPPVPNRLSRRTAAYRPFPVPKIFGDRLTAVNAAKLPADL